MKWMLLPATALVVLAGCSPASDRGATAGTDTAGSETAMMPTDTGTAATGSAGATTPASAMDASGILSQLELANRTEIQQGQAAAKQASTPAVKEFAGKIVKDHKANTKKLQQLATKMSVTLADSGPTESQSAGMGELAGKTGQEFDRAYIDAQIQAHQQNIEKIRNQMLPAADPPDLRDFLQTTATEMEGHLASAKQLQQDLSSGG